MRSHSLPQSQNHANFPAFEATFVPEQDSFRAVMEDYDAHFPRGSCRRDSRDDRLAYAKTLAGGVLALTNNGS
eukprot:SAG31_NODE_656_length_13120_cov_10.091237_6_plen_73_part_00